MSSQSSKIEAESTTSSPVTEPVEVPLTQEQKEYLTAGGPPLMKVEAEILEKGTLTPEGKAFLEKKMNIEKKYNKRKVCYLEGDGN